MKRETYSRYEPTRKALLFWCLFIGIGAVAGAVGMLVKPDGSAIGMQELLPCFQVLPFSELLFQNFIFPGIALLCVNGIPNLIAAGFLWKKKVVGVLLGGCFGATLMAWICIQFVIFPMNVMSTSYFIFGAIQLLTGLAAWIFYRQEHFHAEQEAYPEIGKNPRRLVVYFSRMGYTRKAAFEEANRTGARVYELHATERTEGTLGFWWCGRFGMHRWEMPLEQVKIPLENYDHVTICTPVWVFHLAAPMRSFCRMARGRISSADYILVHYQNHRYENVAREMDELLGIKGERAVSICSRQGRFRKRETLFAKEKPEVFMRRWKRG